jgi:hypothetical protein
VADSSVSSASGKERLLTSFSVWIASLIITLIGPKRLCKPSPRRPNWRRDRFTSGAGTKSGRSLVLRKLNVCARSSTRWTKPTLQNGNSNNWVAKLSHLTPTATD